MPNTNGIITAPVDVERDIAYVLGRTGIGDVGQLCGDVDSRGTKLSVPKIRAYAKYKPVRWATWAKLPAYGYRAVDNSCGLSLTMLSQKNGEITKTNVQNATRWDVYEKQPTGGSSQPFRVLDFDGYRHNEVCPMNKFIFPDVLYSNLDTEALMLSAVVVAHLSDTQIAPYDIMQYFTENKSAIEADTTTFGYFGLMLIGTGTEGDDAVFASYSRSSQSVQPTIDINMTQIGQVASSAAIFATGKDVILAPCICNINTNGQWKNTASYNSLQVILWPSEIGAFKSYTLRRYVPPVLPDYYITIEYSENPYFIPYGQTSSTTMTITIQRRTGSGICPSLFLEHDRYTLRSGGHIDSTEHRTTQLLMEGGRDPDDSSHPVIVETLISGMKWRFTKVLSPTFFISNTGMLGYKTLYTFSTPMNPNLKLSDVDQTMELTEESQDLQLSWYRN